MYSWKVSEGQGWITLNDTDGNHHLFPVSEIVHVYSYTSRRQTAFKPEEKRLTVIELRASVRSIEANVSVEDLTKMICGDRSSKEA